jgi:outer membrane protein assembly factor BamE (lipoprotein component of BamABCDE complex)
MPSLFDYTNDGAGRRVGRDDSGSAFGESVATMRTSIKILLALLALFCLPLIAFFSMMEAVPVSKKQVARLTVGMTKAEVLAILGEPSQRGPTMWTYSYRFAWPMVNVQFEDERMTSCHLDR